MMNAIKSSIIAVGLLLLTGCANFVPSPTPTPVPTSTPLPLLATNPEDIVGIWLTNRGGGADVFYQFNRDGTYRVARGVVENLQDQAYLSGEFWFEGTQLFIKQTAAVIEEEGCFNATGIYEVELLENGNLYFVMLEDGCEHQVRILQGEWEPLP